MSQTETRIEWMAHRSWSVYWFDTEVEARNYVTRHPGYRLAKRTTTVEHITPGAIGNVPVASLAEKVGEARPCHPSGDGSEARGTTLENIA